MRISSKRYHWDTKQGVRNAKGERIARVFQYEEQAARNRIAQEIGEMPSPQGTSWQSYIIHRLNVMNAGIETYTVPSYARLRLDKHIRWHRAIDKIAGKLVNHKPSLIFMGAGGSTAANSPIRVRKHVRCPAVRKLIAAFKKRANCVIIMVDEYMTSQHCARCFKRFPQNTRNHRFKKCTDCEPNPIVRLPTLIVTNVGKRTLQMRRAIQRTWNDMQEMGDAIAAVLQNRPNSSHLVSSKQCFVKTWQQNVLGNVETGEAAQPSLTTVWHRDIVAAKLILYKGMHSLNRFKINKNKQNRKCAQPNPTYYTMICLFALFVCSTGHCKLFNEPIHENLKRPTVRVNNQPLPHYGGQ